MAGRMNDPVTKQVGRMNDPVTKLLERYVLGSSVPDKSIATHFTMTSFTQYYCLTEEREQDLIVILANQHDTGRDTFVHEKFGEKFALLFDIDGDPSTVKVATIKEILSPIHEAIRHVFDYEPSIIHSIVYSACSESKISYHIHFPDIIINKQIMKTVYTEVYKRDKSKLIRELIDEQIISSQKLRMAFSDKWDQKTSKPLGRKLQYLGSFNSKGTRYTPEYEEDTKVLLEHSCVRRSVRSNLTPLNTTIGSLAALTMNSVGESQLDDIDLRPHDDTDFSQLDPEWYSLQKIPTIIHYLRSRYCSESAKLCEKVVKYMNNFIWMVTDHPGKIIFVIRKYNFTYKDGKQPFSYIQKSQTDFLQYFQHVRVKVSWNENVDRDKTISEIWISHPMKRCYSTIIFDPRPESIANNFNDFNIYQGLYLQVQKCVDYVDINGIDYVERVQPFLTHINEVWCADCPNVYKYVIRWIAHAILRPWIKMGVALVLVGSEGCGKSIIVDTIGTIFGTHYLHITDMDDLVGRFTSLIVDKMLVFADEAFWGGCKSVSGKLKGMITEKRVRIEYKNFDAYYVDNYANYIFASNNFWAVPAGESARRWCCLGCTRKYNRDTDYFKRLHKSLNDNEFEGLKCLIVYLLKNVDLDGFVPGNFPKTPLLRAQKQNSYDSLEAWWDQVLQRGYVIPWDEYTNLDPSFMLDARGPMERYVKMYKCGIQVVPLQKAYEQYKNEQRDVGIGRTYQIQRFRQFLKDNNFYKKTPPPSNIDTNLRRQVWIRIHFSECRELWRDVHDDPDMPFEYNEHEDE